MQTEPLQNLMPKELIVLVRIAETMLSVLSVRMFTLLAMLLTAGLFAWVLYAPDWIRFAGAVAFALLVFWPVQRAEHNRAVQQGASHEQETPV